MKKLFLGIIIMSILSTSIAQVTTSVTQYDFTYPNRESLLADDWDFIAITPSGGTRNTEQTSGAVVSYDQTNHLGVIRIPADVGTLWGSSNDTRNSLFRDLPSTWVSIRLNISAFNPTQNYQEAGLMVYDDDDNYIQITRNFEYGNKVTLARETLGSAWGVGSVDETATSNIYLRIDRDQMTENLTTFYSLDGNNWTQVGNTINQGIENPRLAIIVGTSPNGFPDADIASVEVHTQNSDELRVYPNNLVFNTVQGTPIDDFRTLYISTTLGRDITWEQSANVSWLSANLASGGTETELEVSVDASGLAEGIHTGNLTLTSTNAINSPIVVPVTVIVNPDVNITATTWRDGKEGAFSVSTDDGASSGYDALIENGFEGTFVANGLNAPSYYSQFYNSGMELGAHLLSHICQVWSDDALRQEIEPNVDGIINSTTQPADQMLTLVWPCGVTNYREQEVASEYFLAARGYNINQLEDATPQNFMNIKSFNSRDDISPSPENFITLVDAAISEQKWFNLVLHFATVDDGAIAYAGTRSDELYVAPIGDVVKYIKQRDRFIITNYNSTADIISFNASRLALPSTPQRNFENAFDQGDITTLQIDIDDYSTVESVLVDGVLTSYNSKDINGNAVLLVNVLLEPGAEKLVQINYLNESSTPSIYADASVFNFDAVEGETPADQFLTLTSNLPDEISWTVNVLNNASWLNVSPVSGTGEGSVSLSINSTGYTEGSYTDTIVISSPEATNAPLEVVVNFTVHAPTFPSLTVSSGELNFNARINEVAPASQLVDITNTGNLDSINWSVTSDTSWLTATQINNTTPGTVTVSVDHSNLTIGTHILLLLL